MKRVKKPDEPEERNIWPGGILALVITAVIVLLIMIIAWALPESSNAIRVRRALTATPLPTALQVNETGAVAETEEIPTAESVGYGDGIIVASAGLIVLVLGLVLQELLIHRKRIKAAAATGQIKAAGEDNDEPAG